jgi:predicted nucleic acid-binding protein
LAYAEVVEYLRGRDDFADAYLQLSDLLREVVPVFVDIPVADRYSDLRRRLRPPHGPGLIGDVDALIAATAIETDLTLVTTDSDFERVPGLRLMRIDRAALR